MLDAGTRSARSQLVNTAGTVPWAHEHNSCCLRVLEGKNPAGKPSDKADEHVGFNDRVGAIVTRDVSSMWSVIICPPTTPIETNAGLAF